MQARTKRKWSEIRTDLSNTIAQRLIFSTSLPVYVKVLDHTTVNKVQLHISNLLCFHLRIMTVKVLCPLNQFPKVDKQHHAFQVLYFQEGDSIT